MGRQESSPPSRRPDAGLHFLDAAAVFAADAKPGSEGAVFEMRERFALAQEQGRPDRMLTRGQYAECRPSPTRR